MNKESPHPEQSRLPQREAEYAAHHMAQIEPFFEGLEKKTLLGREGVTLSYVHVPRKAGVHDPQCQNVCVVIVPGRTESYFKYAETMLDLHELGFEIFAYDHRGQGFSERLLADPHVGFVQSFDDYEADLQMFLSLRVQKEKDSERVFLLAHSMGAVVSLRLLRSLGSGENGLFQGLGLSAPMLEITLAQPTLVVEAVVTFRCLLGKAKEYASFPGGFDAATYGDDLTSSQPRLAAYREGLLKRPVVQLGMPSNQWMREALRASAEVRRWLAQASTRIRLPLFVVEPGDDSVVRTQRQELIHNAYAGSILEVVKLPGAKHDAFLETDEIRGRLMHALVAFLESFSGKLSP